MLISFCSSLSPELQVRPVPSVDVLFSVVVAGVVHKHIVHAVNERVEVPNLYSGPKWKSMACLQFEDALVTFVNTPSHTAW